MKMYERVYDDIHLEREDIELHRIYHELYPVQEKEISARLIGVGLQCVCRYGQPGGI